jgi:hypothetical protein
MVKIAYFFFHRLVFFTLLLFLFFNASCTPKPEHTRLSIPGNRNVIVTHLGEVTKDTKYSGEVATYRIYYKNTAKMKAYLRIIDQLDRGLTEVKVLNSGTYFPGRHLIVWDIGLVNPGQKGMVNFAAKIGRKDLIQNFAMIQIGTKEQLDKFDPKKPIKPGDKEIIAPDKFISNLYRLAEIKTNVVETKICPSPKLGWIPFIRNAKLGEVSQGTMKGETTMGTMVNFNVPGMFVYEVIRKGIKYHRLSMHGKANLENVGKPELPLLGQIIEVPFGVSFSLEIVKTKFINLGCYNIYPAQEPEIDSGSGTKAFIIDKPTYLLNSYYPAKLAKISVQDIGVIRGHRLVFLKVHPIQYNPVTRQMKAFSQIEVNIKYNKPAQIKAIDKRLVSPVIEELLNAAVLNFKDQKHFENMADQTDSDGGPGDHKERNGCDYLIITHDDFYNVNDANNPVIRFKAWKQQKGLYTKIVKTSDILNGNTADGIKAHIADIYKTWNPVPTYILLVGDSEFIPTNYETNHGSHSNTDVGTDLYYVTVDGGDSDYFADIFLGRISVDTLGEATDVIDKMINYERNPTNNAGFYNNSSVIALFEDDDDLPAPDPNPEDGIEDRPWIENIEEIREGLINNGYAVDRMYATSSGWPGDPASDIPNSYQDGTALPAGLRQINGFQWNGSGIDITNALNNGRFLVNYRDHGSRTGWSGFIGFDTGDINALNNGDLTPLVLSLACENGWFDNETDDAVLGTNANTESFCEHFQRHNNGGSIAIIGASRISWTGKNDFLMFGFHKAIFPGFVPNPPITGYPAIPDIDSSPLLRMGQILNFGKIYMANAYNHDNARQITFEMYHLFGDPEMPIWTEEPASFDVVFPVSIGSKNEQDFVVKVKNHADKNPVHLAQVALTQSGEVIGVQQTNPAGIVRFTLANPTSGDIKLTVTKFNYRPFEDKMEVTDSGAQINRLDPLNGPVNQVIHVGGKDFDSDENVEIYFDGALKKTTVANAGEFGQSGVENIDINVPTPYDLGPVNIRAKGKNSDRSGVDVFNVRSENPIDLYMYDQWDDTTWHLHNGNNPTWNNPDVQIFDLANNQVESNNLIVGTNYKIQVKVHNDTNFEAKNVKVTLRWANYGAGQPENVWNDMDVDEITIPANTTGTAEVTWAPPSTGHLCIRTDIYHIEDINTNNNKGQENCHVGPTSSPAEVVFTLWNPTKMPAMVHLELRQLILKGEEERMRLWGSWIKHPDPQLVKPGEEREVWVIIDPDLVDVKSGEIAEFSLTAYIKKNMIGGVNFIIQKK